MTIALSAVLAALGLSLGTSAGQARDGALPCRVTEPVFAEAPRDSNADPVRGYFHISADRKVWAPSAAPGERTTGIGRYFVRPAGVPLTIKARRLDAAAPEAASEEQPGSYPTGFYFGGLSLPTDGCWEVTVRAGESAVTFTTSVRYTVEQLVERPTTETRWSKEIGTLAGPGAMLTVAAVQLEDPGTTTGPIRAVRIDLTGGGARDVIHVEDLRLEGTRSALTRWAGGARPMIYGLGRSHNARGDAAAFEIVGNGRTFSFPASRAAEFAQLLLDAAEALKSAR